MSLFRNFAVLRLHKDNPFAPIQILTGDTRKGCALRHRRLHDDGRPLPPKSRIERRFESSPGVQRVATLGVFLRYFLHAAKSNKNRSLFGNARVFPNLDSARRNGGFAETELKPSQKEIRGSANLEFPNQPRYFKTVPAVSDIHTSPPVARKTGQTSLFSGRLSRYTLKG